MIPTEDFISVNVNNLPTQITVNSNGNQQIVNQGGSFLSISEVFNSGDARYYPKNSNPSGYSNLQSGIPSGYIQFNNGNNTSQWLSPISPKWCSLRDDFIGGTNADGQRGELGWRGFSIGGTPTFSPLDPSADNSHYGIMSITTPSVANQGGALTLSDGSQPQINNFNSIGWDSYFVFKIAIPSVPMRFRLGFSNSVIAGGISETNRGIWLRYDKDASYNDTGYYFVCRDNAVNQQTPIGVVPDSNWHTLRMWCENTGFINYSFDNLTGLVTNTSNNGGKIPHMVLIATSTTPQVSYFDYFGYMGYCGR